MPIRVLPVHLVNQIAAGEVIERPASVVKELVENALDAGAKRIDVTIEDGGKRLIRVADDGGGLSPEDLALAFVPHATSKLPADDDLFAIRTMGFRGEALASVASIAHCHARTRRVGETAGCEIEAAGPELGELRPCPGAPGTVITVRDLFYNTPARRKFLRTATTEAGHVSEQLTRLALAHPPVAFTLTHNTRKSQDLPAVDSTRRRAEDLFGSELSEDLLPIERDGGEVRVRGLIGRPSAARSSGKWQYVFVNGRYVRDRMLSHALREAYRGLLDASRWPVAVLFIDVPPEALDVNVHPTKIEVRFRESQQVHGELLAALKDALNRANLTPSVDLDRAEKPELPGKTDARKDSLREALADFFQSAPNRQPRLDLGAFSSGGGPARSPVRDAETERPWLSRTPEPPATPPRPDAKTPHPPRPTPAPAEPASPPGASDAPGETLELRPPADADVPPALQLHESYLVTSDASGVLIIDQHALHERLIYNDLKRRLTGGALESQRVLIPRPLRVSDAETALLETHAELLELLGVEVSPFGPGSQAIQRFPTLLIHRGIDAEVFLREMLDTLADDETADAERLVEQLLAVMACKAAVKAGDPLSAAEIDALLARRERLGDEKLSACPHGRPTTIRLTFAELEKQFKRT